jgi:NhaP-type Na+/H+ or K+/H+ antiporter
MHAVRVPRAPAWREAGVWVVGAFVAWLSAIYLFFNIIWSVGDALSRPVGSQFGNLIAFALGGVVCGAILGVAAWLMLRLLAGSLGRWVLVSTTGFTLGTVAGFSIAMAMLRDDAVGVLLGGAVIGLGLGVAQWSVLRHLPRARWWIVANVLAVAAAFWCAFALGGQGHETRALLSSSTALALLWVVQREAGRASTEVR